MRLEKGSLLEFSDAVRRNIGGQLDGCLLRSEKLINQWRILTTVDFSHRDGRVSYSHLVFDSLGTQINQVPLSVLGWCGIGSTSWVPQSSSDLIDISDIIGFYVDVFYCFIRRTELKTSNRAKDVRS